MLMPFQFLVVSRPFGAELDMRLIDARNDSVGTNAELRQK